MLIFGLLHLPLLLRAQTVYPDFEFFRLQVTPDGRIEANLKGAYGIDDPFTNVFRNFIEMDRTTGDILVVFGAAPQNFRIESWLRGAAIKSGEKFIEEPFDATPPEPGWFMDNMILWWDSVLEGIVMIYQQGCMSCWSEYYGDDWLSNYELDAMYQTLWKTMTFDVGDTWTDRVQLLKEMNNPHVQYQIIESLDPDIVMITVHHLDESNTEGNYQYVARANRRLDPDDGSWYLVNMTSNETLDSFGGYIQATAVRPVEGEPKLVAFLRDRYGQNLHRSESNDDGLTWTTPVATPIPNADLMSQAVQLRSGRILLIYNPQPSFISDSDTANRMDNTHTMMTSLSEDDGITWTYARPLVYAYDAQHEYPAAMQDPECGNIYVVYSNSLHQTRWIGDINGHMDPYPNGCSAYTEAHRLAEFEECVERTHPYDLIKFNVINERWIMQDEDHTEATYLEVEGCMWDIPDELKTTLKYLGSTDLQTITESKEPDDTDDEPWASLVVVLTIALILIFLVDVVICIVRRLPKNPNKQNQGSVQELTQTSGVKA